MGAFCHQMEEMPSGKIYPGTASQKRVCIHLSGQCAGSIQCPGVYGSRTLFHLGGSTRRKTAAGIAGSSTASVPGQDHYRRTGSFEKYHFRQRSCCGFQGCLYGCEEKRKDLFFAVIFAGRIRPAFPFEDGDYLAVTEELLANPDIERYPLFHS